MIEGRVFFYWHTASGLVTTWRTSDWNNAGHNTTLSPPRASRPLPPTEIWLVRFEMMNAHIQRTGRSSITILMPIPRHYTTLPYQQCTSFVSKNSFRSIETSHWHKIIKETRSIIHYNPLLPISRKKERNQNEREPEYVCPKRTHHFVSIRIAFCSSSRVISVAI